MKSIWLIISVIAVHGLATVGVVAVRRHLRKTRWPFATEDKLLRGPGEELRRQILRFDEDFAAEFFIPIITSLLVLGVSAEFVPKYFGISAPTAVMGALIATLVVILAGAWRMGKLWQKRSNNYLGWFGERYVAEWLEPTKLQGWRIFHDVPFTKNGAHFNIDHVAVGVGGVFVFETKTRRKGRALPGRKDNSVTFNGQVLSWPWGEDTHGLDQAERNAAFFSEWIKREIGERVSVAPFLVLPGWWLELKPAAEPRRCRVINPKWIPGLLEKERPSLPPKLADLIALRLTARCRDVEE